MFQGRNESSYYFSTLFDGLCFLRDWIFSARVFIPNVGIWLSWQYLITAKSGTLFLGQGYPQNFYRTLHFIISSILPNLHFQKHFKISKHFVHLALQHHFPRNVLVSVLRFTNTSTFLKIRPVWNQHSHTPRASRHGSLTTQQQTPQSHPSARTTPLHPTTPS